jgi:hypothetical protein
MAKPHSTLRPITQEFSSRRLADLEGTLSQELCSFDDRFEPGARIAVAVGSRGIRDIQMVVRGVVAYLRERGAEPFIVPAMGSHGGATAQGQEELLSGYGITEALVGAPVRSSMDVAELLSNESECPVFMDRQAWESDGVVLVNRVKVHTDYQGDYESGLAKMAVIGLGKHAQALAIHRRGVYGLKVMMPRAARDVFASGRVLGGVAIVEDAFDETMCVRAIAAEDIMAEEPALLALARENMPRLPLDDIDVLIVDRLGKDISGVGMDPNIIGRMAIRGEPEFDRPRVKAIIVRDISDGSHGNALGIGLADIITKKLYDRIDFAPMHENVFTSTFLERAKVPVVAETDEKALAFALRASWVDDHSQAVVVRIRDTLHVSSCLVSESGCELLEGRNGVVVGDETRPVFGEW